MCECFQIGGTFISFDPDCPAHGYEAQAEEARRDALPVVSSEDVVNDLLSYIPTDSISPSTHAELVRIVREALVAVRDGAPLAYSDT